MGNGLCSIALLAGVLALGAGSGAGELSFTDITQSAGTAGPVTVGQTGGHGAMFADVDDDGLPDLYITMIFNVPMPDLFFHNKGACRFAEEGKARGLADWDGGSHGTCFADLDNDGDYDLVNGATWDKPEAPATTGVYQNDGRGYFRDGSAAAGIPLDRRWPTRGVCTFDMDGDGDLDIFCVTNYQGSKDPAGEQNELYRNDGNLRFTAITTGALVTAPCGQGAIDTDFDGDGDVDIIAANRTGEVNVLRNDGRGTFTAVTPAVLGLRHRAGDGISAADVNTDGRLDLVLATSDVGHLYLNTTINTTAVSFTHQQTFKGTDGYMAGFADLDNDGDVDIVFAGDKRCYLNDGAGVFRPGPAVPKAGINDPRGIGFADIDNDGDVDFAVGCKRSGNLLVRNNLNAGNWLKVRLVSPDGQAGAFGAKVRIYPAGEKKLLCFRESRSANGYLGQDDPVLHFGLGRHTAVDVEVTFLGGATARRRAVAANRRVTIAGAQR